MMRALLILPVLGLAAACAPTVSRGPVATVSPLAEVMLAGGPEGESPVPGGDLNPAAESAARRPAPGTAAMAPSPRMAAAIDRLREKQLLIPVAGVCPSQIEDSFTATRDGGERRHNALDILAPRNTPVLAADDGAILRLSTNALGGITIYASDRDRQLVYYYAHLDRYRDGLTAGMTIQKGDTLGYVGTTGNAPTDVPHLHFQIMVWPADGISLDGEPINPYPFLRMSVSGGARPRFD
jgi:peptidoglycan LD-endopeptidase LytH